jgi:Lrp/AsnC family transcriptional regulator for asnA, asnC and gidA
VDKLDRLIIQALQVDGRTPFTQIAGQAGVSETTIRTRYQRLVDQGIVRTVGIIDPSALDYEATAMVAVSAEPGMAGKIARTIAGVPEVSYLVTTLGSYDLFLEVFCRDLSHLTDVVTRQIQQIPGVRATETLVIAESYKLACDWSPYPKSGVGT